MNLNDKFLLHKLPKIAEEKLNTKISDMKFIGGGSFGKVYKCTKADGETIILKAYHVSGMETTEANQLQILGKNTSVKMPKVYFTYNDDEIAVMCMSFIDGKNALAQILKKMNPKSEEDIIKVLSEVNPELCEDLRSRLFTFEDVINADDRFIQEKLREMPVNDICHLIAGKSIEFRKKILQNVSQGRRIEILEQEEILTPMRKSDCERITSTFFCIFCFVLSLSTFCTK